MKVLFITRKWPPAVGGMETYSRELTDELKALTDLQIYPLPGRADGSPPGALALTLFFARAALLILRRGRTWDLVHFGDFVLFPLAWLHAKVAPTTPRVITVHGLDLIFGNRKGWKARFYRGFMSWARRRRHCLDTIIANSRNTARLVAKAGLGKSVVIPLGVRLTRSAVMDVQPVDPQNRYVLFVGRLVPRKGAAWFAAEVLPRLPEDVSFTVVGKTWDKAEEFALSGARRVKRLGYVGDEELTRLRAGAVAVVMPNIPSEAEQDVEGFGITALEAAVGGAPLVAADLEGISDAVVDQVTGFLVEPQRPDLWSEKLRDLCEWSPQARQAFSQKARDHVADDFSWARVSQDTVRIYQRALARS